MIGPSAADRVPDCRKVTIKETPGFPGVFAFLVTPVAPGEPSQRVSTGVRAGVEVDSSCLVRTGRWRGRRGLRRRRGSPPTEHAAEGKLEAIAFGAVDR